MATITSSSTTADIAAAYLDNCGYYEDSDADMARRFVTVLTAMLSRGMTAFQNGEQRMEFSPRDLREMIREARQFVAANSSPADGGAGVTYCDMQNYRD